MTKRPPTYSSMLDHALKRSAHAHRNQTRKGSDIPYVSHPAMVGLILQRAGFDEEIIAAGILHDVVEDTTVTREELSREFGLRISDMVGWLSETKLDEEGKERSWEIRKQEHFEQLQTAPVEVKAIALADKLHNLQSTLEDQRAGVPIWSRFKATKDRWLWNAARVVEACDGEDLRLKQLAAECREVLNQLNQSEPEA